MTYQKACKLLSVSNPGNYEFNLGYAESRLNHRAPGSPLRFAVAAKVVIDECKKHVSV